MSHSGALREEAVRQGLTGCVGLRPGQMLKQESLGREKEPQSLRRRLLIRRNSLNEPHTMRFMTLQ